MAWKGSKREHKILSIMSKVNAVAIKCYDEQLVDGVDALIKAIESCDKEIMFVLAICHDRDEQTDGVWKVSKEKRHYHILVKYRNRLKKERVSAILEMLHIKFREGLDDFYFITTKSHKAQFNNTFGIFNFLEGVEHFLQCHIYGFDLFSAHTAAHIKENKYR